MSGSVVAWLCMILQFGTPHSHHIQSRETVDRLSRNVLGLSLTKAEHALRVLRFVPDSKVPSAFEPRSTLRRVYQSALSKNHWFELTCSVDAQGECVVTNCVARTMPRGARLLKVGETVEPSFHKGMALQSALQEIECSFWGIEVVGSVVEVVKANGLRFPNRQFRFVVTDNSVPKLSSWSWTEMAPDKRSGAPVPMSDGKP